MKLAQARAVMFLLGPERSRVAPVRDPTDFPSLKVTSSRDLNDYNILQNAMIIMEAIAIQVYCNVIVLVQYKSSNYSPQESCARSLLKACSATLQDHFTFAVSVFPPAMSVLATTVFKKHCKSRTRQGVSLI